MFAKRVARAAEADWEETPSPGRLEAFRFEPATAVAAAGQSKVVWVDMVPAGYFDVLCVRPL
jgi:hypothetical protein